MAQSNLVQSLQRALDLLEQTASSEKGLRLTELADKTGLKKTTVHNLVRTLLTRGYLVLDNSHRYQPGPAIEELTRTRWLQGVFSRAETEMKTQFDTLGGGVLTFAELVAGTIVCRLRMTPEQPAVLFRPIAQTFAPFGSASGLCLQAFNPNYRDSLLLSGAFENNAHRFAPDYEAYQKMLSETVQRGVAIVVQEPFTHLAAPIGETYTLGLNLKTEKRNLDEICSTLLATAKRISGDRTPEQRSKS